MKNIASSLIDLLPKAELHLHIEGTLEPEMLMQLAKRNKVELPYETVEEVRQAYDFSCLQDFLDLYYLGMSVLVTEKDFFDLTWAYLQKVHGDRLTHVEMFFDPQPHMDRGIAFDVVLGGITHALEVGRKKFGITSKLIMCFVRHLPEEHAFTALGCACNHKKEIFGVGMDSTEVGIPPRTFQRLSETQAQGEAMGKVMRDVWKIGCEEMVLPVALGAAAAHRSIPVDLIVPAYLHAFSSNLISVAVRLVPVGQTQGQRVLLALHPLIDAIAQVASNADLDDLTSCTFLSDVASMRHETQIPRIFKT
jgi:hypothetical protein